MEDFFATERNGHQLTDNYDPMNNTLDIRSNGKYPSNVLSNLCSNGFRFDGMVCGSMEGFLQSLKHQDRDKQRQICSMKGGNARKRSVTSWQTDQIIWWKGQAYDRQSEEYQALIRRAYQTMFDQSERFRAALMQTRGITLVHSSGETNPYKTILTAQEFCTILTELRDNYDKREKNLDKIGGNNSLENLTLVVFSHGKESGPFGSKIQRLMAVAEELGLRTASIDYRDCTTADERVALLNEHLNQLDVPISHVVLVGSSMGGYVSTVVANEQSVAGLFLMAPALWMNSEEYVIQSYCPKTTHVEIVHGMLDDIVPYENSIRFAKEHDGTVLHLVPDDHRLSVSNEFLACQFRRFLDDISKDPTDM
jgi:predicted esterase